MASVSSWLVVPTVSSPDRLREYPISSISSMRLRKCCGMLVGLARAWYPKSVSVLPMRRLLLSIPSVAVIVAVSEYKPLTSMAHLSMLIWSDSLIIPSPPTSRLM